MGNEITEKECIVAFIDILGFSEIMNSKDVEFRLKVINLLENISQIYSSSYEVNIQDFGGGRIISHLPEVSTFSDNIVISIPIIFEASTLGFNNDLSSFITAVFCKIVSIIWEGLHLGIIFRGAITKGRLYHNKNIVAGSSLVHAVEMEKNTKYPRIEIDRDVINSIDDNGKKIIDELTYDAVIKKVNDKFYLNSFAWHNGVWRDYFYLRGEKQSTEKIKISIEKIKLNIDKQIKLLNGNPKEKWVWLKREFYEEQEKWNLI